MESNPFRRFCEIAHAKAGIHLPEGKAAVVTARMARRIALLGLGSPRQYLAHLEADQTGDELVHFLDAIAPNVTGFFREADHFHTLSTAVQEWVRGGCGRLRFWCAACSTGEEAYSMAMTIAEAVAGEEVDFKILASDISTHVLLRATVGRYEADDLKPVSRPLQERYLAPLDRERTSFEVQPGLRKRIIFKRLNLSTPPFPISGPLHGVFCRNVMIYLDLVVRQKLVEEIERLLGEDSLLFIGRCETLQDISTVLAPVERSIYRRRNP